MDVCHQCVGHAETLGARLLWVPEHVVSFEAVPLLPLAGFTTTLVVREPLACIASMLALGWFAPSFRSEFALFAAVLDRHFPTVLQGPPADDAARYWLTWNLHAAQHADHVFDLSDVRLIEHLGITEILPVEPRAYPEPEVSPKLRRLLRATYGSFRRLALEHV